MKNFRKISEVLESNQVDESKIGDWAKKIYHKSADFTKKVSDAVKRESRETREAYKILRDMIKGKEVSHEDKKFLKLQSIDLVKVIPLVFIQGLPGAIPITALLVKLGNKYNVDILPNSHKHRS